MSADILTIALFVVALTAFSIMPAAENIVGSISNQEPDN